MRSRRNLCAVIGALLLLSTPPVLATVIRGVSLEESVELSDMIVIGQVIRESAFRADDGRILTSVAVRVDECLKGPCVAGELLDVTAAGGELDGERMIALGEARYERGQKILVQLEQVDGRLRALGLSAGKWDVIEDTTGQEFIVRDLSSLGIAGSVALTSGPISLDEFRSLTSR